MTSDQAPGVRRSELVAALSLATDIGMGQPLESGLATCLVATALAERLGLGTADRQRVHQLALLQHIGCTAAAAQVADVLGDELLMRSHASTLDFADKRQMLAFLIGHVGRANPVIARPGALVRALVQGSRVTDSVVDVCEAGQLLGRRLGYDEETLRGLDCVLEYWDGEGFPGLASGDSIPVHSRVVQVATLAVSAHRAGGVARAAELVRDRSGHTLGPAEAAAFLGDPDLMLAATQHRASLWDDVIAAEPVPSLPADDDEIDRALQVVADFVDLKEPCLTGHSSGVAALAADAAQISGLPQDDVVTVRRAGWVHDLGRVGISSSVWGHAGPLTADQWERVRLHPYYTDRVLDRTPYLRRLADIASAHHEQVDGQGYYRGSRGTQLPAPARILAAADAFHAMTEARPYRGAMTQAVAAEQLRRDADDGRLDRQAVHAVLDASGQPTPRGQRSSTGLTPRELEILRHVVTGLPIKTIARRLGIAPKTVDGHIQRIYAKIGVSSRAGAALFAMRHDLVPWAAEDGENSP